MLLYLSTLMLQKTAFVPRILVMALAAFTVTLYPKQVRNRTVRALVKIHSRTGSYLTQAQRIKKQPIKGKILLKTEKYPFQIES